ncbi:MAG: V-type ATP synthase subunit K [Candidatus Latescibacterota bacterium]
MWDQVVSTYFIHNGVGWAVFGAMMAVMFGCIGSAIGIRIACSQAAGVLSEKPDLFGKLLVLMALPGTQGFYGFICAIFIALRIGLLTSADEAVKLAPPIGIALFFVGVGVGLVQLMSSINQGQTSAASINLVGKRPDEGGRAILFPALVETYAVVALLVGILMTSWLTKPLTSPLTGL